MAAHAASALLHVGRAAFLQANTSTWLTPSGRALSLFSRADSRAGICGQVSRLPIVGVRLCAVQVRSQRGTCAPTRFHNTQRRGVSSGGGSRATLRVYAKRAAGVGYAAIEVDAGASVAVLVEAIIAKLRLDASPGSVTITTEGTGRQLDSTLRLSDAVATGVLAERGKLVVSVLAPQTATTTATTREFVPVVSVRTSSTAARFTRSLCTRVSP